MVTEIRIYFEGDFRLRPSFSQFLETIRNIARSRRMKFRPIAGGGNAISDYAKAVLNHSDSINVLLIDSDHLDDGTLIEKLRNNRRDWPFHSGSIEEENVHFMVQVMESWFLADRTALRSYFGSSFLERRLPQNPDIEAIPKDDVLNGLRNSSRPTTKGTYHKTKHAPDLLARIDPTKVQIASPSCKGLFDALEKIIMNA